MKQWIVRLVVGHIVLLSLGFGFAVYKLGWFQQWFVDKPVQIIKSNEPINTSKPVKLTLKGPAQSIRLSWQMLGMEMGNNYYKMLTDDQKSWWAETMLPICSQKRLDWLLTLEIDQSRVLLQTQSGSNK